MNKRTFLKLLSAGLASRAAGSLRAALTKQRLTNWAGNINYSTDRVHEASSLSDIRSILKSSDRIRVLGSRHCFNSIADSRFNLLALKARPGDLQIDANARKATVAAALRYGDLAPELDRAGFALHNLASLPHISIAGACSTATHGSGERNGNLATAVSAIEFVAPGGELMRLSRSDGDVFNGAVVGLGALGVITHLTLDVLPRYSVRQYVYQDLPLEQMAEHFDSIQAAGYSVSLFTDWQKRRINEVWIKTRVGDSREFATRSEWYGAKLATRNLHPIADLSAENCTEQMGIPGPWYDRLPHFRMGFTPSAGKELQSEYFVPRSRAVDAILAIERLRDQVGPHLLISEIRTVAADDLWMSPAYKQSSVAIHFTWKQDWAAVRQLLPAIERQLSSYNVRPHWGKLFSLPGSELRARYPRLPDFVQLATRYDPDGKLRNDFLIDNVFGRA